MITIGLDNGIILHTKKKVDIPIPLDLEDRLQPSFNGNEYEYEICYWRKCWNIRAGVKNAFHLSPEDVNLDFLAVGDVKEIWKVINFLNKKKRWEHGDEGDSIWTYKEMRDHLDNDLTALEWLIYVMRHTRSDEYRVEFYDSY